MRRLVLCALLLAGCGEDDFQVPPRDAAVTPDAAPPKDIAGVYSMNVTNGMNGCGFANWTEGAMTAAVPFTITQADADVTGEITGVTGTLVMLATGSRTFVGKVDGAGAFTLTLIGSRAEMMNQCTFTRKVIATGTSVGDSIMGQLDYTVTTNGSPDCASIENCHTIQRFSGSRPPR